MNPHTLAQTGILELGIILISVTLPKISKTLLIISASSGKSQKRLDANHLHHDANNLHRDAIYEEHREDPDQEHK
jgi:hypothetical protein